MKSKKNNGFANLNANVKNKGAKVLHLDKIRGGKSEAMQVVIIEISDLLT